eukprot:g25647.t1
MSAGKLDAYIVDAVRSPVGKRKGSLAKWHPADLGAFVVDALLERNQQLPPAAVDDVICGCVSQVGAQTGNLGRNVVLSSKKLPLSVPGTTVDRQCGSGQQALHFAAQAVASGSQDVVVAMGVEVMSLVPIGSSVMLGVKAGYGMPMGEQMQQKWPGVVFSQFRGAELLAAKYGVTRQELDQFALESHERAAKASEAGRFKKELVPVPGQDKEGKTFLLTQDEGVRKGLSLDSLKKLKTLAPGGVHTAGTASQISDGASAVLVVNARALKKYGLKPRARIHTLALAGSCPDIMLEGPIPATQACLAKSGLSLAEIDLYEVNEAFGTVPLAWLKALKAERSKLNVNGGAQALGHPLGCTGTKLMTTLLNELERRQGKYGLLAICEGGGTANAMVIERVDQSAGPQSKL